MKHKIFKCIADTLSVDINDLEPYISMDELSADIIDTVSIVMNLEEIFDIDIDDNDVEALVTLQDIIDLIEDKVH